MVISKMIDGSKVVVGEVDHHSSLYSFSHFVPKSDYDILLTPAMKKVYYGIEVWTFEF